MEAETFLQVRLQRLAVPSAPLSVDAVERTHCAPHMRRDRAFERWIYSPSWATRQSAADAKRARAQSSVRPRTVNLEACSLVHN